MRNSRLDMKSTRSRFLPFQGSVVFEKHPNWAAKEQKNDHDNCQKTRNENWALSIALQKWIATGNAVKEWLSWRLRNVCYWKKDFLSLKICDFSDLFGWIEVRKISIHLFLNCPERMIILKNLVVIVKDRILCAVFIIARTSSRTWSVTQSEELM